MCHFFAPSPNHAIHNKHLFRKTTRNEDDVEFVKNMQEKYTGLFRKCKTEWTEFSKEKSKTCFDKVKNTLTEVRIQLEILKQYK